MKEYDGITRIQKISIDEDPMGRPILPVPAVKVTQGESVVILHAGHVGYCQRMFYPEGKAPADFTGVPSAHQSEEFIESVNLPAWTSESCPEAEKAFAALTSYPQDGTTFKAPNGAYYQTWCSIGRKPEGWTIYSRFVLA